MKRALLVEDNLLNRELLRTMLEGSGWAVDEADNGAEALRMLEKSLPDVVLTDLQMPVMGGLVFLKEVRKQPRLARLTVFAVSAYAMQGDRERALAEGQAVSNTVRQYLNRLSDLMFVMARVLNRTGGGAEHQWDRTRND